MLCLLCLQEVEIFINIFGENGNEFDVASILSKYFWFTPTNYDKISTIICRCCWSKVTDFNEFYLKVEEAHRWFNVDFSSNIYEYDWRQNANDEVYLNKANEMFDDIIVEELEENYLLEDIEEDDEIETQQADKFVVTQEDERGYEVYEDEEVEEIEENSLNELSADEDAENGLRKFVKTKQNSIALDAKIANFMKLCCNICQMECANFKTLKLHMENEHDSRGYAICCGENFYRRIFLAGHIEKHKNPNVFSCTECDKTFATKSVLQRHVIHKHEPENIKRYQCEKCDKKFTWSYLLENHRCSNTERTYLCKFCELNFPTKYRCDLHIKLKHSKNQIMCDICAEVFYSKINFKRHMAEHNGVVATKVQCDQCNKWLKTKQILKKHKLRHTENKSYNCDKCDKLFRTTYDLSNHKRYVHGNLFPCAICSKICKTPSYLREHMSLHTGEELLKCTHCSKKFRYKTLLYRHRKENHPKEFEESLKNRYINPKLNSNQNKKSTAIGTTSSNSEYDEETIFDDIEYGIE